MMLHNEKSDTPDSFYSWLIAILCSIMYFLVYGMFRISGVLFAEIVTSYNIDRQIASLPFVIHPCVRNVAGPVVGYLHEILGFRPVIMMGTIIFTLGIGGCFFADNIVSICVLLGLVTGIGNALATSALPQIIYLYFKKHVSTATGFALAGASMAGFVLSPVTAMLLVKFGLSGTFLVLGGIVLHTLPIAMFLKEPKSTSSLSTLCCNGRIDNKREESIKHLDSTPPNYNSNPSKCKTVLNLIPQSQTNSSGDAQGVRGEYQLQDPIKISNSQMNAALQASSLYTAQTSSGGNEKKSTHHWFNSIRIFWNPAFLLISFPRCLQALCFIIVPTVLVDFAKDKGIHESMGAYLLMVNSIADLFGKVVFGWVTDRSYMTVAGFSSLTFIITAVSFVSMVWSSTFSTLFIAAVFSGACMGAVATFSFRMISEYIEKDMQTVAMTSSSVLGGPVSLLVSPLIGYFRDDLGSYNYLMYSMAAVSTACGGLLLFLPRIANSKMTN